MSGVRDHAGRFDRWGQCRGCAAAARRDGPGAICGACESEAEAVAEARHDRTGRR